MYNNIKLISIIVIGLNEEKRLNECLNSIIHIDALDYKLDIVYVDSGSTDKSIEIAESFSSVKVISLDDSKPSAAKARNLGVSVTAGDYIQFVDGDSALDRSWLEKALPILRSNKAIGAVFGEIEEIGNQKNIYMKVCRFDWYTPPGDYRLCGGNALWRRSVFNEVGVFDGDLIAGEEPDLCFRVRQLGYRIVCIDTTMVKHDLDMKSFKEYWSRSVRSGLAYAIIAMRYRHTQEKMWLREMIRNFIEPAIWLSIIIIGTVYNWKIALALLVIFLAYRIWKVALNILPRSCGIMDSLLYAVHIQFSRIPLAYGQFRGLYEIFLKKITNKKKSKV